MTQTSQHFEAQITRTVRLNYLLYLPPNYDDDPHQRFPIILYLHSAGGRGSDLALVRQNGIAQNLENGQHLPFIVVSPQCPSESHWTLHTLELNALLDDVIMRFR